MAEEQVNISNFRNYFPVVLALIYWGGASYLIGLEYQLETNIFAILDISDIVLLPFIDVSFIYIIFFLLCIVLIPRLGIEYNKADQEKIRLKTFRILFAVYILLFIMALLLGIFFDFSIFWGSIIGGIIGIGGSSVVFFVLRPWIKKKSFSSTLNHSQKVVLLFIVFISLLIPLISGLQKGQQLMKYGSFTEIVAVVGESTIQGTLIFETHNWLIFRQANLKEICDNEESGIQHCFTYLEKGNTTSYVKIKGKKISMLEGIKEIWKEKWN